MSKDAPKELLVDASRFRIAVVAARYNAELVDALLEQVVTEVKKAGAKAKRITVERVPGSNELPVAAKLLLEAASYDVVVALGVLIRGDTIHYELIADAVTHALQDVALASQTPVINGVVVAENRAQAEERCRGKVNRGAEFAAAALEMARLKQQYS